MNCVNKKNVADKISDIIISKKLKQTYGFNSNLNLSSAKIVSLKDSNIIHIPFDAFNPNSNVTFGKLNYLKEKLNEIYDDNTLISFVNVKSGFDFNIHPSSKLIDRLNIQYQGFINNKTEEDDVLENYSGREFTETDTKAQRPVTDNITEYIKYKKSLLKDVSDIIKQLNSKKRKKFTVEIKEQLSNLYQIQSSLKNDIDALNKKEIGILFEVINKEITELSELLDNPTAENISNFKQRLNFLYSLIKGDRKSVV